MATTQGCVEVTLQQIQAATITVPSGMTPVHAVAAVHQSIAWQNPQVGVGVVEIAATNLQIQTRGLRPGDCVCWTAYDA